ncbi:MAG: ATP-binding protein, partial [Oceanospirillaceae bacterium]|nr:ATP-binding protein [Oceanospirillaceae bacterium]
MYFYQIFDEFREFYKFSLFSKKKSNSIGSRLLIWVLAVSSLFVIFQTLFQVNNDYKLGLTEIDRRFHQINLSYQGSLSRSIWEVNNSQIISTIEGMLQLPDVVKVVVFETGMERDAQRIVLAEMGTIPDAGIREKTMPILIESRGKSLQIGSLKVVISLESL